MQIENQFDIEDVVYLKTDQDQKPRMVTGITVTFGGALRYELSCGSELSEHFEFEISAEIDVLTKCNR